MDRGLSLERENTAWDPRNERSEPHPSNESRPSSPQKKRQAISEETFSLSAEYIGLLIGKGGVTIKDIQYRSGANIEVTGKNESEREGDSRTVSIVGTKAQVKITKILIEERLGLDDEDEPGEPTSGLNCLTNSLDRKERGKQNRQCNAVVCAKSSLPMSSIDAWGKKTGKHEAMRPMSENLCSSKSPQASHERQEMHGDENQEHSERLAETVEVKQNQSEKIHVTSQRCAGDRKTSEIGARPQNEAKSDGGNIAPFAAGASQVVRESRSGNHAMVSSDRQNIAKIGTPSSANVSTGRCDALVAPVPAPQSAPAPHNPYQQFPHAGQYLPHYRHGPPPMYGEHPMMQYPYYGQPPHGPHPSVPRHTHYHPPGIPAYGAPVPAPPQVTPDQKSSDLVAMTTPSGGRPEGKDATAIADGSKRPPQQTTSSSSGQPPIMAGPAPLYYGYGQPGHPMMYPPPPVYGAYPYGQPNPAGHHPAPQSQYGYPLQHATQGFAGPPPPTAPAAVPAQTLPAPNSVPQRPAVMTGKEATLAQ